MPKILVIEDSEDITEFCRMCIQDAEAEVEIDEATDGREGYEKFIKTSYDLIITDFIMPKMDGFTLIKKIRGLDSRVPIILMTGFKETLDESIKLDPHTELVEKPFTASELIAIVDGILELHLEKEFSKVLIVDDSKATRFVIRNNLMKYGFTVIEALNGAQALQRVERFPGIDIIVSDYEMPEMDGLELAMELKNRGSHIPVIMLSSKKNFSIEKLKEASVKAWVPKPFKQLDLINAIQHVYQNIKKDKKVGIAG